MKAMNTIGSTTSEVAAVRPHSSLSASATPDVRLDQALEADQQHRRAREAVLRRWLGYSHKVRRVGHLMALSWIPGVIGVIVASPLLGNEEGAGPLLSILWIVVAAVPLLAPFLVLSAWGSEKLLLKRAVAEALAIERTAWQDPFEGSTGEVRGVQRKVDDVFNDECACARFCVWVLALIPVAVVVLGFTPAFESGPGSLLNLLMVPLVTGGFASIFATCGGLICHFHRRAILKDARQKGLAVRNPADSPWS